MQGIKRKIVFVTAYEVIGWLISALALAFFLVIQRKQQAH